MTSFRVWTLNCVALSLVTIVRAISLEWTTTNNYVYSTNVTARIDGKHISFHDDLGREEVINQGDSAELIGREDNWTESGTVRKLKFGFETAETTGSDDHVSQWYMSSTSMSNGEGTAYLTTELNDTSVGAAEDTLFACEVMTFTYTNVGIDDVDDSDHAESSYGNSTGANHTEAEGKASSNHTDADETTSSNQDSDLAESSDGNSTRSNNTEAEGEASSNHNNTNQTVSSTGSAATSTLENGTLTLYDVVIGAYLSENYDTGSLSTYNPCSSSGKTCMATNGMISCVEVPDSDSDSDHSSPPPSGGKVTAHSPPPPPPEEDSDDNSAAFSHGMIVAVSLCSFVGAVSLGMIYMNWESERASKPQGQKESTPLVPYGQPKSVTVQMHSNPTNTI
ncbi:hypothetical protein CYMTET_5752 [Cymbomonas tetramitiformis]|uniref:Uncharacterized protein n=1 Tax=Cymbomonas tetramitiformis TaxID=36881 RepID=A0AAE0GYT5_9CHLO|nr:hypothetical protein CYMTET_5752 [Cymbomonas tetramitiformis]